MTATRIPRVATWTTLLISVMCLCVDLCRSQGKLEAKLVLGRTSVRQGEPLYLTYGVVNTTAAPAMASVLTPSLGIEAWTNGAWSGHERELVPEESWPVYRAVPATDELWAEQKTSVAAAGRYRVRAAVVAGGVRLVSQWAILEVVAHEGNAGLIPTAPGTEAGPAGMSAEQFTFGSALNMQPRPLRRMERGKHP